MSLVSDNPTVYVLDDDGDLAASLSRLLKRSGYHAEPFKDPSELLVAYPAAFADCVVTDVDMETLDGFAFAERLRELDPAVAIVFMTAWPTVRGAVECINKLDGVDYLEKPVDESRLLTAIAEGVGRSRQQRARLRQ